MPLATTIRLTRRRLPHWEVEHGRYFVTVRCADSLPAEAVARMREMQRSIARIAPRSVEFATAQRHIFLGLERSLDAGHGSCPLRSPAAAAIVVEELSSLADWEIAVPHYSVMPNHWHALLAPRSARDRSLSQIMKRVKGRTAKRIRQNLPGTGPFWQTEWFDRWVRNQAEWLRISTYLQNNPVKAGLCHDYRDHPWTR